MLVQQTDAESPLLGRLRITQTNARTAAVLFNEDDACGFEGGADSSEVGRVYGRYSVFCFGTLHRRNAHSRLRSQLRSGPAKVSPRHPDLCTSDSHNGPFEPNRLTACQDWTKWYHISQNGSTAQRHLCWLRTWLIGWRKDGNPASSLTATCSIGEPAMATRAHSTPVPASRRRPHQAVTASTMPKAPRTRRADTGQPALPGAAALLRQLTILWRGHAALEAGSLQLRQAGQPRAADATAVTADRRVAQAEALERVALAFPPATPADAIAQLILAHAEIGTLVTSDGDCEAAVRALLEVATRAVATLAKADGFDLTTLSFHYLTEAERMIVHGEVPA